MGSAELYNVLDGLPDVAVVPHASAEVFGLGPAFGRPKFMIKDLSVAKDAELLVELRYSPIIFAERAEAVCSEISRSIAKIPRERGIGSFSVAVVPVRPGALDPSDCLPH